MVWVIGIFLLFADTYQFRNYLHENTENEQIYIQSAYL